MPSPASGTRHGRASSRTNVEELIDGGEQVISVVLQRGGVALGA